jgi:hypothetical protein
MPDRLGLYRRTVLKCLSNSHLDLNCFCSHVLDSPWSVWMSGLCCFNRSIVPVRSTDRSPRSCADSSFAMPTSCRAQVPAALHDTQIAVEPVAVRAVQNLIPVRAPQRNCTYIQVFRQRDSCRTRCPLIRLQEGLNQSIQNRTFHRVERDCQPSIPGVDNMRSLRQDALAELQRQALCDEGLNHSKGAWVCH